MKPGEDGGRVTLTAMLLAGGQSQRMGFDKAAMSVASEPLWRRQLGVLRALEPASLWVSAREVPWWRPAEIEVVPDQQPSRGPLSGLAAGLRRLQTSHLLVLAIDLPRMSVEHLRKLVALTSPGCGVIPRNIDYFEPLCAIYPVEAAAMARAALAGEDLSLQHLADNLIRHGRALAYSLTAGERALYLNLNRPGDVPAALEATQSATPGQP